MERGGNSGEGTLLALYRIAWPEVIHSIFSPGDFDRLSVDNQYPESFQ